MSRFLPDALDHLALFGGDLQLKLKDILVDKIRQDKAPSLTGDPLSVDMHQPTFLSDRDYMEMLEAMRGARLDVARGIRLGGSKLRPIHPLAANGGTPDIILASSALKGAAREFAANLLPVLDSFPNKRLHVFDKDYRRVERQMVNAGFDVSNGIEADGVELVPVPKG